jgi:hypothetical protein
MGYRENLGRQWKFGRHSILQNIQENEPESAYAAPARLPSARFRMKTNQASWKGISSCIFRDLDNARIETLTFDLVDIYHRYLAIFGRGFMNKFDAVIRQQFLCMKIPAPKGVIIVFGDQQEARNIEKGHTPGQVNVYKLKTTEERKKPYEEAKREKEKIEIAADGETKKVYLDDMPDRAVTIGAPLNPEEEKELIQFLNKNKDVFV